MWKPVRLQGVGRRDHDQRGEASHGEAGRVAHEGEGPDRRRARRPAPRPARRGSTSSGRACSGRSWARASRCSRRTTRLIELLPERSEPVAASTASPSAAPTAAAGSSSTATPTTSQISNNQVTGNSGVLHGGIRVGHPYLALAGRGPFGYNSNLNIHHNAITLNGAPERQRRRRRPGAVHGHRQLHRLPELHLRQLQPGRRRRDRAPRPEHTGRIDVQPDPVQPVVQPGPEPAPAGAS